VTVSRRVRWRLLAAGLLLSTVAFGPLVAAQLVFAPEPGPMPIVSVSTEPLGRFIYLVAVIALLIPAAAAEELMFRGWLLRQTSALLRQPGPLIALTAILFSAIHLDFSPDAFLTRALMGAGFAYMTLRLGGIEFATGVHASNNILIVLFVEPLTAQTVNAPSTLSASSLFVDGTMVAAYILITEAVARLPALRRWSGVHAGEVSGPGPGAARLT
jgi:membrane protease YdiL (CAAX protease family)